MCYSFAEQNVNNRAVENYLDGKTAPKMLKILMGLMSRSSVFKPFKRLIETASKWPREKIL